ncbi:hypothetical protein BDV34DRAFT_193397 [Aspergillus parasiticus]|uniref:Uncharacterized protein n=1 Tax=Aspergillus parasiticus TaxID=5067 RepID=A0A5N6DNS9_ASPPA|nr:hypothetical protein BDV34DRAFT_193397 [Aspergillus parasiticus]
MIPLTCLSIYCITPSHVLSGSRPRVRGTGFTIPRDAKPRWRDKLNDSYRPEYKNAEEKKRKGKAKKYFLLPSHRKSRDKRNESKEHSV